MEPVVARFALSPKEIDAVVQTRALLLALGPALALMVVPPMLGDTLLAGTYVGLGVALAAVAFAGLVLGRPRNHRRLRGEQTWSATDEGLTIGLGGASLRFPWGELDLVDERRGVLVLRQSRGGVCVLPRRAVSAEAAAFVVGRAAAAGVKLTSRVRPG